MHCGRGIAETILYLELIRLVETLWPVGRVLSRVSFFVYLGETGTDQEGRWEILRRKLLMRPKNAGSRRIARLGQEIKKRSIQSIGVPCLHFGLPALERTLGGICRGRCASSG